LLLAFVLALPGTAVAGSATGSGTAGVNLIAGGGPSPGTPYPVFANISGLNGPVNSVSVTLENISDSNADDVDVLLVGPAGQAVMLMSDACAGALPPTNFTFVDAAPAALPSAGPCPTGSYTPTNYEGTTGEMAASPQPEFSPPPPPYADSLAVFNGTDPNGTWWLYAQDDTNQMFQAGSIPAWRVTVTTSDPSPTVSTQAQPVPQPASRCPKGKKLKKVKGKRKCVRKKRKRRK